MNYYPFYTGYNENYQQNLYYQNQFQCIDYLIPQQHMNMYQPRQNFFNYDLIEYPQIYKQMNYNLNNQTLYPAENRQLQDSNLIFRKKNKQREEKDNFQIETPYKHKKIRQIRQKEGRNMLSNLFRQGMKIYMHQKQRTIQLVAKIAEKYKINVDSTLFVDQLERRLKNLRSYIRIGQIQSFIKGSDKSQTQSNSKILRILLHKFLREDIMPSLCHNAKVHKSNRIVHLRQVKRFMWMITSI